jgi:DNA primase
MLANAGPLWAALPEGALKRQLLGELATTGRDDAEQLLRQWGHAPASRPVRESAPVQAAPRRLRAVGKGAANLLDRAVWLLLRDSELWARLDGESHDILGSQDAPYDLLFGAIERCIHEHGALAPSAMLDELRQASGDDTRSAVVLSRIAAFHDPEPESDIAGELSVVIAKLRLQAVDDELRVLFDSGAQSPDAQRRSRELMDERRRLKT